jgi:hypothetical protein
VFRIRIDFSVRIWIQIFIRIEGAKLMPIEILVRLAVTQKV